MGVAIIIAVIVMNFYPQSIESKSVPICNGFICGDGTCVNGTRCDGVVQCADGSDEHRCERQSSYCSSNQYRCSSTSYYYSRRCIPLSYRCDGDRDCSDGSDERNCQSTATCHSCLSTGTYSTYICSTRCDRNTECSDRSDEEHCSYEDDSSALIGIIVGSVVGGLFIFIGCPTIIIIIVACAVYHASRSGQTTIITTHPATTTVGGDTATAPGSGGATDQPGFQLQKLDYEKQAAETSATASAGVATSELTQPAPPPYTGAKPVLYLPAKK